METSNNNFESLVASIGQLMAMEEEDNDHKDQEGSGREGDHFHSVRRKGLYHGAARQERQGHLGIRPEERSR